MASVHLHLNEKFVERLARMNAVLPSEPVVLVGSRFKLSFVANSELWRNAKLPYLNIVASDARPLNWLEPPYEFTASREEAAEMGITPLGLKVEAPQTTLDYILQEFKQYVHFELDEIDQGLLQIDRNVGRELFINEVGSWRFRPNARTKVRNLFLAGDYIKNPIDVVCLEGAVVSGLQAAELVRRQCGVGVPIEITRPKTYPTPLYWPLKLALAPYAVGAKIWSLVDDIVDQVSRR